MKPKEKGQGLMEYAVILIVVTVIVIISVVILGPVVARMFNLTTERHQVTEYCVANGTACLTNDVVVSNDRTSCVQGVDQINIDDNVYLFKSCHMEKGYDYIGG